MKKTSMLIVAATSLLLLGGCAAMFSQGSVRHGRSSSLVDFLYPDGAPPATTEVPELKLPLTVGIAFLPPAQGRVALLDEVDKARILERVRERFESRAFIRDIVPIPDYYLASQRGFNGLAALQRLYDLDLVALVSYDQVARQSGNELSLTYLTIVGSYLFPGTSQQVNTLVDLAVVDPASRSLVLRAAGMDSRDGISTGLRADGLLHQRSVASLHASADGMIENFDAELKVFEQRVREGTARVRISGGGGSMEGLLLALLATLVAFRLPARLSSAACRSTTTSAASAAIVSSRS